MIIRFQALGRQCGVVVCVRSSTRKLVRWTENQLARKKLDYHSMRISDNQYLEKVFKNLRQKLNRSEIENPCIGLGII